MRVLTNFLIAVDQAVNCVVYLSDGWGQPDETISARAYRLRNKHHWLIRSIDTIFFWQDDHCYNAYLSEVNRTQQGSYYSKYLCSNADNLTETNEPLNK